MTLFWSMRHEGECDEHIGIFFLLDNSYEYGEKERFSHCPLLSALDAFCKDVDA